MVLRAERAEDEHTMRRFLPPVALFSHKTADLVGQRSEIAPIIFVLL
jgi:hypothetical protein